MNSEEIHSGLIWITGFSAAGKTTVARKANQLFKEAGYKTIYLDGDDLRNIFSGRWGHDRSSRVDLANVYFHLCSHLSSQGYLVIISAIAMFGGISSWVNKNIPNAIMVYLNVPENERRRRDAVTKKLFVNRELNDDYYDIPEHANLMIENYGRTTPDIAASQIVNSYQAVNKSHLDRGRNLHWQRYYEEEIAPNEPTSYAQSVFLKLNKNDSVLEIGCGNGRDASYFALNGLSVSAIDRSVEAIKACQKRYAHLPIEFIAGTVTGFSKKRTQKYDAVYSRFVLHAMPLDEEIETLQSSYEFLKKGGSIYIECRSINDPLARSGEIISPTERIGGHYRRFIIIDELIDRLTKYGYGIVDKIESNGLAVFGEEDPVVIRITAIKR